MVSHHSLIVSVATTLASAETLKFEVRQQLKAGEAQSHVDIGRGPWTVGFPQWRVDAVEAQSPSMRELGPMLCPLRVPQLHF